MSTKEFGSLILDFAMVEVERNCAEQVKTMDLMRDTSKILIGASGFILGLIGILGSAFPAVKFTWWMLIPYGCYLISFILSLVVVVGSRCTIPFTMKSYEGLLQSFQGQDLNNSSYEDLVNQRLNNYLFAQKKNESVLASRIKIVRWAITLFILAIISAPIVIAI